MPQFFSAAGSLIDAIRINATSSEMRGGRVVWVKRRRPGSGWILRCANWFFRAANSPVRVCEELDAWQRWEVGCFRLLNGGEFNAFPEGRDAVCAEPLPGRSLDDYLRDGALDDAMVAAAGRELRRAHALCCEETGGLWSHGDPHLANFLFDSISDRARMIDFEVFHDLTLPAIDRHADDLLVFLQDMVGIIAADRWLPAARSFVEAYDEPEVVAHLRKRLVIPRGIAARAWWIIRTNYLGSAELRRRFDALRAELENATPPEMQLQPTADASSSAG